jgi:nucleoside phosphorylase
MEAGGLYVACHDKKVDWIVSKAYVIGQMAIKD